METKLGTKIGQSLKSAGNFVKENPKPLLYLGGTTIAVVLVYAIVKKWKKNISKNNIKQGSFINQEIDESKTTITNNVAKNYAESLFEAFNYTWGTDKSIINEVFSKITSEDFKKIYNAFGERSYNGLDGGTPKAVNSIIGNYYQLDLVEWLNNELGFGDSSLKTKIRPIVNGAGFVLEK